MLLLLLLIDPPVCYCCCCCEKDRFGNYEDQQPIDIVSLLITKLSVVTDRICSIADADAVGADQSTIVVVVVATLHC